MSGVKTMFLYTVEPIDNTSVVYTNPITNEQLFETPFNKEWFDEKYNELKGNLRVYLAGRIPVIKLERKEESSNSCGSYSPFDNKITIYYKDESNKYNNETYATLVHELQHVLQTKDKRSSNGSSSASNHRYLSRVFKLYKELGSKGMFLKHGEEQLFQLYSKLGTAFFSIRGLGVFNSHELSKLLYTFNIGELEARKAEGNTFFDSEKDAMGWRKGFVNTDTSEWFKSLAGLTEQDLNLDDWDIEDVVENMLYQAEINYKETCIKKNIKQIRKLKRLQLLQQLSRKYFESSEEMQLEEEQAWEHLGDSYKERMNKPRTNYKNKK